MVKFCDTSCIAELTNGDKRSGAEVRKHMSSVGSDGEAVEFEIACVCGLNGAAVRKGDGDWMCSAFDVRHNWIMEGEEVAGAACVCYYFCRGI